MKARDFGRGFTVSVRADICEDLMRFLAVLILCLTGFVQLANAAPPGCDAAREGTIIYNKDRKLVQFCNGTEWVGMVAKIGGAGDTLSDLTCLDGEVPEWNGTAWICGAGGGDSLWSDSGAGYLTYVGDNGVQLAQIAGMPDPEYDIVGDLGCTTNQILKWDGDSWACAADASGTGGFTALTGDVTASGSGSVVATIAANAIGSTEITDLSIAAGDIANTTISLGKLSASGTPSATTYLRGDNTWASISNGADNLGDHIATQTIVSDTNNTDDLGTTAVRWKDGWFAGNVTAATFAGSGASLTALNATNLSSGTVAAARLPAFTGDVAVAAGTTVTSIAANAVTSAKILDATVASADITDLTITGTDVANATLAIGKLSATGTPSAATYLRGDNTWATVSGGSVPVGTTCGHRVVYCDVWYNTVYESNTQCAGMSITALCDSGSVVSATCPSGYTSIIFEVWNDDENNTSRNIIQCSKT